MYAIAMAIAMDITEFLESFEPHRETPGPPDTREYVWMLGHAGLGA